MLQCLEWEPSGSFYQKRTVELNEKLNENGALNDHSGTSGLIDINLVVDMTDPTLPPNPRKAILYRPSVTQLIAVSVDVIRLLLLMQLCCFGVQGSLVLPLSEGSGKGSETLLNSQEAYICHYFSN